MHKYNNYDNCNHSHYSYTKLNDCEVNDRERAVIDNIKTILSDKKSQIDNSLDKSPLYENSQYQNSFDNTSFDKLFYEESQKRAFLAFLVCRPLIRFSR